MGGMTLVLVSQVDAATSWQNHKGVIVCNWAILTKNV